MNSMYRIVIVLVVSATSLLLLYGAQVANAQTTVLTEKQVDLIRKNCQSAKSTLSQLHASDALLRVNRGQVYESLSTRLIEPFNSRLGNNGLDNKATSTVATNYRTALDTFRSNYRLYEQELSAALKIDCHQSPVAFHESVERARTKRKQVNTSVVRLHRVIDDYRLVVDDFTLNYNEGR